jgi:hypothetical protein
MYYFKLHKDPNLNAFNFVICQANVFTDKGLLLEGCWSKKVYFCCLRLLEFPGYCYFSSKWLFWLRDTEFGADSAIRVHWGP